MIRPTIWIDSPTQFPTLREDRTDRWKGMKLGYGVGWGTFESRFGHAYFKEGHDDGTENYAMCVDKRQSCILLMANDNRAAVKRRINLKLGSPLVDEKSYQVYTHDTGDLP